MVPKWLRAGFAAVVLVAGAGLVAFATDDPASKSEEAAPAKDAEPLVFDNEYLTKRFGAAPEAEEPPPADDSADDEEEEDDRGEPAWDPLADLEAEQRDAEERRLALTEAEAAVNEAKGRVVELEKRLLQTRNPLLARPAAPEGDDGTWDKADGVTRVRITEEALDTARRELEAAEAEVSRLRRTP